MSLALDWHGEALELRADHAVFLPAHRTLLVADVHLGKAHAFRRQGVPVPAGTTAQTLARLSAAVDGTRPERLVVLGDLLHSRHAQERGALDAFALWCAAHASLALTLVRGNHDSHAGDPPAGLGMALVDEPYALGALALCHHPGEAGAPAAGGGRTPLRLGAGAGRSFMDEALDRATPEGASAPATLSTRGDTHRRRPPAQPPARVAGHVHPCVVLRGSRDNLRLPCFHLAADVLVLPAFGAFTGMQAVRRRPGERVFAIADAQVVEIPAP